MQKNVEKMSINYSPNFNLRKRSVSKVKYLIFHYTGMKSENGAIKKLTNNNSGVSCHYFVRRNGNIVKIVPDLYIAWHAGNSAWMNYRNINSYSIGIELDFSYEFKNNSYNYKMIASLKKLLKYLLIKYSPLLTL